MQLRCPTVTKPAATKPAEALRYGDALAELEAILLELEGDNVDVDELATRVRRGAELIDLCRDRIANTRFDVQQVIDALGAAGV